MARRHLSDLIVLTDLSIRVDHLNGAKIIQDTVYVIKHVPNVRKVDATFRTGVR